MKRLIVSFFILNVVSFAQTDVSGTISSNTTWDASGSPYTITGNTVIMDGVTLTIDPGVTVIFNQSVSLGALNGGTLIAQGAEEDSIYFRLSDTNSDNNSDAIIFNLGSVGTTVATDTNYVSGSVFSYVYLKVQVQLNENLLINNSTISAKFIDDTWNNNNALIINNSKIKNIVNLAYPNYQKDLDLFLYNSIIDSVSYVFNNSYNGMFKANNSHFYRIGQLCLNETSWSDQEIIVENCTFDGLGRFYSTGSYNKEADISITNSTFNNIGQESGNYDFRTFILGEGQIEIQNSRFNNITGSFIGRGDYYADNFFTHENFSNIEISNSVFSNGDSYYFIEQNEFNYTGQINLTNNLFIDFESNIFFLADVLDAQNNALYDINSNYLLYLNDGSTITQDLNDNYWGTKSSLVIDSLIYDFYDDPNFNTPIANYTPFLLAPPDSLVGLPSSITNISLKTDSTYQTTLTENIDPGDTLFIELTGVDTDSLYKGLSVVWVVNIQTQDTIYITLIESSEMSGLYRGSVFTGVNTDNIHDIIEGQDGQMLEIISRMNFNQRVTVFIGDRVMQVQNLDIGRDEDLQHLVSHTPNINFRYYDSAGETQTYTLIQVSDDPIFSSSVMWSGSFFTSDTSFGYNGEPLEDGFTYYLRVKVGAGSFYSNWSYLTFRMNTKPTAPILVYPINNEVFIPPVELQVLNTTDAEDDTITYSFNVYSNVTLTTKVDSATAVAEGTDTTSWQITTILFDNEQYFWTVSSNDSYEESVILDTGLFLININNDAPETFILSMPLVDTEVQNLSPVFIWHPANDPDPIDTVYYKLMLDTPDPGVVIFEVGADTSFQVTNALMDNTEYFWQVTAEDVIGFQTINEGGYQTFYTNVSNDPPSASTLVAPLNGSIQTGLTPNFYWTEAVDPDPLDHVSYTMNWWPLGVLPYITSINTDSTGATPDEDIPDNAQFGWMVVANDMHDSQSSSDTSYFYTDAFPEPPLNFATVFPENNVEGLATEVEFVWEETDDPDPIEEISYRIVYASDWEDSSTYIYSETIQDTSLIISLADNSQYYWLVEALDSDGFIVGSNDNTPNTIVVGTLSIDGDLIPIEFALHQNYPNPFNPVTTLRYDLPENGHVNIIIYDMMGRQVKTLVSQSQDAGYKSVIWNAANDYGKPVSAGIYLYQIQAGEYISTKKMVLLK